MVDPICPVARGQTRNKLNDHWTTYHQERFRRWLTYLEAEAESDLLRDLNNRKEIKEINLDYVEVEIENQGDYDFHVRFHEDGTFTAE